MNIFKDKRLNDLKKKRKTLGYSSLSKEDIIFLNKYEKKSLYSEYNKTPEFQSFDRMQKLNMLAIALPALIFLNNKFNINKDIK
ncbi:hypothetical protein KO488_08275 [Poseidonibacter lekithochrous]|uniref:hypothetical protein n=1 Tax=Poseidonibacter TaxID=2321187 RepID=UPI001C08B782|nr:MULTISPECIES: hypothetical protein [Poseidonibacter]MBU3014750.1 hypothetical protein [Poseidonibacter lekithochrous]MDO6828048.1 hypothetical protein [Poseidonibacter sp. 1_MG-2023]